MDPLELSTKSTSRSGGEIPNHLLHLLPPPSHQISNPFEFLQVTLNPDGSLTRHGANPISPPNPNNHPLALSKDVPLNRTSHNTYLRIFLPSNSSPSKLPVIIYVHGGGFVFYSAATTYIHDICVHRAAKIPAIVVSVEYRLAPEHRLPAAYDDALDAILWLRTQALAPAAADPWIKDHADFNRCFIMGCSAGGNIAYDAGLRSADLDLSPLRIRGLILNQPYFGGEERTESEARSAEDKVLPLAACDLMWELSLPVGANRDHEYCNPIAGGGGGEKVRKLPRCLARGFVGDPLYDRQKVFVDMLKRKGVRVVSSMGEEGEILVWVSPIARWWDGGCGLPRNWCKSGGPTMCGKVGQSQSSIP